MSSLCCVTNGPADVQGANASAGGAGTPHGLGARPGASGAALTADAFHTLAFGMRISKWRCGPVPSALPLSPR